MTKEEIEVIQKLPAEFVKDGTQLCQHKQFWIVVNPDIPPWKTDDAGKTWTPLKFIPQPSSC